MGILATNTHIAAVGDHKAAFSTTAALCEQGDGFWVPNGAVGIATAGAHINVVLLFDLQAGIKKDLQRLIIQKLLPELVRCIVGFGGTAEIQGFEAVAPDQKVSRSAHIFQIDFADYHIDQNIAMMLFQQVQPPDHLVVMVSLGDGRKPLSILGWEGHHKLDPVLGQKGSDLRGDQGAVGKQAQKHPAFCKVGDAGLYFVEYQKGLPTGQRHRDRMDGKEPLCDPGVIHPLAAVSCRGVCPPIIVTVEAVVIAIARNFPGKVVIPAHITYSRRHLSGHRGRWGQSQSRHRRR